MEDHSPAPTLLLKPEEAARELRVGRHKIFDLIALGELRSIKVGGSRRIPRAALQEYIDGLAEQDGAA